MKFTCWKRPSTTVTELVAIGATRASWRRVARVDRRVAHERDLLRPGQQPRVLDADQDLVARPRARSCTSARSSPQTATMNSVRRYTRRSLMRSSTPSSDAYVLHAHPPIRPGDEVRLHAAALIPHSIAVPDVAPHRERSSGSSPRSAQRRYARPSGEHRTHRTRPGARARAASPRSPRAHRRRPA